MLSPAEALARILDCVTPLPPEQVELSAARGRVLSAEVVATRTLPPFDNSAMDGYAVRAAEVQVGAWLPVRGTLAAGQVAGIPLGAGEVMRIMTGAPLPAGADAVIMQEDAHLEQGPAGPRVRFARAPRPGQHLRRAGEDLRAGEVLLEAGAPIGPGEIGLLAAQGRTLLAVHRRPRVAIVSTGDELVAADQAPGPGQIVGSNSHALAAQVQAAGAEPWVLPIAPDHEPALRAALQAALRADVVLSSGGVSVGEFDLVKGVLRDLGVEERFWGVAMKPGKPLQFGVLPATGALVFGLPGNPASSMVSFELFVRPALLRLLGHGGAALCRPRAPVRLSRALRPDAARLHFLRARARRDEGGALWAELLSHQGSGSLRSMVGVNALLEINPGAELLSEGAAVPALLLDLI